MYDDGIFYMIEVCSCIMKKFNVNAYLYYVGFSGSLS